MSRIAVIGTGYVGLVSGACLADFGNQVTCVDSDQAKVKLLLEVVLPNKLLLHNYKQVQTKQSELNKQWLIVVIYLK